MRPDMPAPSWQPRPTAPPGAPNVVVVLLDDTGFAQLGCYGSDIDTPNMDRLAAGGLQFTNFHTTALCSPSRASLMTGRNHHRVGMRHLSNVDTGYDNCRGVITHEAATLAEVLRLNGYNTFALGKWHLANMEDCTPAGTIRSLAAPTGVRSLPWLSRRSHRPVRTRTRYRQSPGRPASGTRLPPDH